MHNQNGWYMQNTLNVDVVEKDDSYSIMEKLRYNDYDLLIELTQSLMKGDSNLVQYEILSKHNHIRDVLMGK